MFLNADRISEVWFHISLDIIIVILHFNPNPTFIPFVFKNCIRLLSDSTLVQKRGFHQEWYSWNNHETSFTVSLTLEYWFVLLPWSNCLHCVSWTWNTWSLHGVHGLTTRVWMPTIILSRHVSGHDKWPCRNFYTIF